MSTTKNQAQYNRQTVVRTYHKKLTHKKSDAELLQEALTQSNNIDAIKALYLSVGIVAPEDQKAMSCLLYRFKRCNVYFNMLYQAFVEDNGKQAFFDLCYLVLKTIDNPEDFKAMYSLLKTELEQNTAINRRRVQGQYFSSLKVASQDSDFDLEVLQADPKQAAQLNAVENALDLAIVYDYIVNHCTKNQRKVIASFLSDGKKIDSRALRRIKEKLATPEFKRLLQFV